MNIPEISVIDYDSSLIKQTIYNYETQDLTIKFVKYAVDEITYIDVPFKIVSDLFSTNSAGNYFLTHIKSKFKTKTMTEQDAQGQQPKKERPPTWNKARNETRFIKMSIKVKSSDPAKMPNKDWFRMAENGDVFMDLTLQLKPDGEIDRFGNLGMVTQDVPASVYKADNTIKGAILGNGAEFIPFKHREGAATSNAGQPGSTEGTYASQLSKDDNPLDDLPF